MSNLKKHITYSLLIIICLSANVYSQEFQCFDGIDNDEDGLIDIADSNDCGCYAFTAVGSSRLDSDPPLDEFDGNYCFEITADMEKQSGAIWLNNKVDLTKPFNFNSVIYAGDKDDEGADGFAIVFQNMGPDVLGQLGGGLGYRLIGQSIGFEIDTWENGAFNGDDVTTANDHVNIAINGFQTVIVGNVVGSSDNFIDLGNIEDNQYHTVTINWNPTTQELIYTFDNQSIVYNEDIINVIFGGETEVWFGFTGSTGDNFNRQEVCILESDTFLFPNAGTSNSISFCNPENTTINLFDLLGDNPNNTGSWVDPDGQPFNIGSHLGIFNPTTNNAGTYTYMVENPNLNCAPAMATVEIEINNTNPPTVDGDITLCVGNPSLTLSATGQNLLWYDSITDTTGESTAPTINTNNSGQQSYFVSQTINGCESDRVEIEITINSKPLTSNIN